MPADTIPAADPKFASVTPLARDPYQDDLDRAEAERLAAERPKGRFDYKAAARKHAPLLIGAGVVAALGVAAIIARRPLAAAAKPAIKRAARPMLLQAARRRPLQTARFLAHRPQVAAKLARVFR
ncbi:MAG: hypothetical protein IT546_07020 [Caulobacteraceae bacterium]|nr:hypothetical protein [Caulobacteraceae bacterium]